MPLTNEQKEQLYHRLMDLKKVFQTERLLISR